MTGFRAWERKVEAWLLRAKWHAPPDELALLLWDAIQGEAALQFESWSIQDIAQTDGVQKIIDFLKPDFSELQLNRKADLMRAYEKLYRRPNESVKVYVRRYQRTERDLMSVSIDVAKTYDAEHRGFRLLNTLHLTDKEERQVISMSQDYKFDKVLRALHFLYPDANKVPADNRAERDAKPANRPPYLPGNRQPPSQSGNQGKPQSGNSKFKPPQRSVLTTLHEQPESLEGETPTAEELQEHEESVVDDGGGGDDNASALEDAFQSETEEADASELAECVESLHDVLSVTAQKLKHITLGRKFQNKPRGPGSSSTSTSGKPKGQGDCLGCGSSTHWWDSCPKNPNRKAQGPTSGPGTGSRPAASSSRQNSAPVLKKRPVGPSAPRPHGVHMTSSLDLEESQRYTESTCIPASVSTKDKSVILATSPNTCSQTSLGESPNHVNATFEASNMRTHVDPSRIKQASQRRRSFFVFVTHHVILHMTAMAFDGPRVTDADMHGYMVIDTACMRMVAGLSWLQYHQSRLLDICCQFVTRPEHEAFIFGDSEPVISETRFIFPAGIIGSVLLVRTSAVVNLVPLLASKQFLDLSGAVIDLFGMTISFVTLGLFMLPLHVHEHGHLCVCITDWPDQGIPKDLDSWDECDLDFTASPEVSQKMDQLMSERGKIRIQNCPKYMSLALGNDKTPRIESDIEDMCECESECSDAESFYSCSDDEASQVGSSLEHSKHTTYSDPFADFHDSQPGISPDSTSGCLATAHQRSLGNLADHGVSDTQHGDLVPPSDTAANSTFSLSRSTSNEQGNCELNPRGSEAFKCAHSQPDALRPHVDRNRAQPHSQLRGSLGSRQDMLTMQAPLEGSGNRRRNGLGSVASYRSRVAGTLLSIGAALISGGQSDASSVYHSLRGLFEPSQSSSNPGACCGEPSGGRRPSSVLSQDPGPSGSRDVGRGSSRIGGGFRAKLGGKVGSSMKLTSDHSKISGALELEGKVYDMHSQRVHTLHTRTPAQCDVLEGCAGAANLTRLAPQYGLRACQPADICYGWDLATLEGRDLWKQTVLTRKPLLVVWGHPCTMWCIFNRNINYRDRPALLRALQDSERPLVKLAVWTMLEQLKGGRMFLFENPPHSSLWNEDDLDPVVEHPDVHGEIVHMCMHGAVGKREGKPIKKAMKFMSNSLELLDAIAARCEHEPGDHEKVEGVNTKASQEYTDSFCHCVLEYLQRVAYRRNPHRFNLVRMCNHVFATGMRWSVLKSDWVPSQPDTAWMPAGCQEAHVVLYLDANRDTHEWGLVLDQAEHTVQSTSLPSWDIPAGHEIYHRVQQLVPWDLARIQVAKLPRSRRYPSDIPFTHRGVALMYNDGEVRVETEPAATLTLPKQRFDKPVRVGIFFFGSAPEDPQDVPPEVDQDPETPLHESHTLGSIIRFEGITKDQVPFPVRSSVARMHVNLGHPPKPEFMRFLTSSGASPTVLMAASALVCETCLRQPHLPRHRPAKLTQFLGQFAEKLIGDFFYALDTRGQAWPLLGFICDATDLHIVRRMPDRHPKATFETLEIMWLIPYGLPLETIVDEDGSFMGEFADRLTGLGVLVRHVPPDQHHQLGKIERHNHAWRWMWNRVCDQRAVSSEEQVDDCVLAVSHGKNSSVKRHGRSSYQQCFGKMPRLPGELLADPDALTVDLDDGTRTLQRELYRVDGIKAAAEFQISDQVRRSLLRKTAHRGLSDLQPGQKIAVWTRAAQQRGSGKSKRPGYKLATFVGYDPGFAGRGSNNNLLAYRAGRVKAYTREQCRPGIGFETWVPSQEDIADLKNAQALVRDSLVEDGREDGPQEGEPFEPSIDTSEILVPVVMPSLQSVESQGTVQPSLQLPEFSLSQPMQPLPAIESQPSPEPASSPLPLPQPQSAVAGTAQVFEPNTRSPPTSDESTTIQVEAKRPRLEFRSASGAQSSDAPMPEMRRTVSFEDMHEVATCRVPPGFPPKEVGSKWKHDLASGFTMPSIRDGGVPGNQVLYQGCFFNEVGELELSGPNGWDGCLEPPPVFQGLCHLSAIPGCNESCNCESCCSQFFDCLSVTTDDAASASSLSDLFDCASEISEVDDPEEGTPLSRKDRRALDREIPWREIMSGPEEIRDEFVKSVSKEEAKWDKWGPVEPVPDDEVDPILEDPMLAKRCIKSRAAYRDKNCGIGDTAAKCRVVVMGCNDPDLASLDRNAPTCSRLSFFVVLQFYISYLAEGWKLFAGDVEAAFLQGQQKGRTLFMFPPRDGLIDLAGAFPHRLYRILGNVYGLANAPLEWANEVRRRLYSVGFVSHTLDVMCFMFFQGHTLLCILIFHVDDCLAAYSPKFDFSLLEGLFEWGSKVFAPDPIEYLGKTIAVKTVNGEKVIRVHQATYTKSVHVKRIPSQRLKGDPFLSPSERSEHRSCTGSGQWLSGATRPDLSAGVSLLQDGNPTISQLGDLYKLLEYAHSTVESGITLRSLPLNSKETIVVSFGDSSWANAPDLKSQTGLLCCITTEQALVGGAPASPVDWRSCRTKRQVRSTLAAEANAADNSIDHGYYASAFLSECLTGDSAISHQPCVRLFNATDCKSLYDLVIQHNPSCDEKRTLLDIKSIQHSLRHGAMRWVPTWAQLADVLTKYDRNLVTAMTQWMEFPEVRLHS